MPVKEALRAENIPGRFLLDVSDFDENPLQFSRFCLQDLLENIEIFRRMHPINAEIECVGRETVFACDTVENFRRDRVIEMAGAEEERIELIFVLREEF